MALIYFYGKYFHNFTSYWLLYARIQVYQGKVGTRGLLYSFCFVPVVLRLVSSLKAKVPVLTTEE